MKIKIILIIVAGIIVVLLLNNFLGLLLKVKDILVFVLNIIFSPFKLIKFSKKEIMNEKKPIGKKLKGKIK